MKGIYCLFVGSFLLILSCTENNSETLFTKRDAELTGVTFKNSLKESPNLNILNYLYYYNGAGIAAADFNGDGLVDLYFTANQSEDQLYLNKGGLRFEKTNHISGIDNASGWTTGVASVDINGDGLLDIYVCKVGNYHILEGHNLLYVNQGNDVNGVPLFKEEAQKYNLDFSGFSTHSAFFDYDLDGDLDMYLLNHSVYPNRAYGRGSQRKLVDSLSGDRLYENIGGNFVDVSAKAGIFQGKSGYGLGLSISDVNNDGYPDIYVGNDFFENDYLYINQQDGTFKELISSDDKKLGHTTHFSMGNDIADVNNDGLTDILSLDMLPENLKTYKTSGLEYSYPIYQQYLKNGYAPQYMQNTLHLNLGNSNFAEIGNLSGLSATEWSWGALLADFDNDGLKDVFVSNGIKGATNDMDFINFMSNESIQRRIDQGMLQSDMPLIEEIPVKKIPNYIFRNRGEAQFENLTKNWIGVEPSFSNGSIYADLDNDGDLDLVINNVDEEAFILENTSLQGNHLTLELDAGPKNKFGLGTKIIAFSASQTVTQENFISKGYLSAVPPRVHLGLGKDSVIDSLHVIWPGGAYKTLYNVSVPNQITVTKNDSVANYYDNISQLGQPLFKPMDSLIDFVHTETTSLDFDKEPLVPFASSNEGPGIAIADVNQDGLEDFFISGAKKQASTLYLQDESGSFRSHQPEFFTTHATNEDTSLTFLNANDDAYPDLLVVSGGNEYKSGMPLQPRLYLNDKGKFHLDHGLLPLMETNASKVIAEDFDGDGKEEVVIVSDQVPSEYGKTPKQFFLKRDDTGKFKDVTHAIIPELEYLGNIKDIFAADVDANGYLDLVAVGHWMPVSIFLNDGSTFKLQKDNGLENTHGWWNMVKAEDLDEDGDLDLIGGNWGLNSKLKASRDKPITLYTNDFDDNGSIEPIVTYYHKDTETPFASKDELVKQMPFLNKEFLLYESFANASIQDLFGKGKLDDAGKKQVFELASCYFINDGNGQFTKKEFPSLVQSSSIYDIGLEDVTGNGRNELIILGNNYEISTQLGRLDAFHGLILQQGENGNFKYVKQSGFNVSGAARTMKKITMGKDTIFIIGRNNDAPIFLAKK
ncbi:VCBS repeat-containing protein [Flagellimonas algicola]|uniref:ASPIC/UnbV domain-containing protein n=1 Tax=Flagellimonas algicola TaxID=2583815 RepID=A0ABY2WM74_9FLAO|nr:VCBS repeat-containing protein [Allomuricauda algicola]TMU55474.1 hypothetical protein FGG15_14995 [Allomuricauda algicola]